VTVQPVTGGLALVVEEVFVDVIVSGMLNINDLVKLAAA
jgi:hypothetical protein